MIKNLLSFVIPVKDEQETIRELFERISAQVTALHRQLEVIFIDDGSTDKSWEVIQALADERPGEVVAFRFRRNCGKADALAVGFEAAQGEIVFTMDADLQDDPVEIPRFLEKLNEGFDIVSGWKKNRHDPWHKVLPSRVFNKMLSSVNGVTLHDHNCGFKCYRADVVKSVNLYGEMHRMIPSLGSMKGYLSSEIVVKHHPRMHGVSKYGVKRFLRGFMDMLTVYFLKNFRERPLHLFGGTAITMLLGGLALLAVSAIPALGFVRPLAEGLAICAAPMMALGFLSELMVHGRVEKERRPLITETLQAKAGTATVQPHANVVRMQPAQTVHEPLIVIADDEKGVRDVMRMYLEEEKFRVREACDGAEALSLVNEKVDAVLLDLVMPGKNGLECLLHLRNHMPNVPVIVVSGNDDIPMAVRAIKMGAFDYVTKPFSGQQLVETIRRAVQTRVPAATVVMGVA